jgi:hypothetical protein
MSQAPEPLRGQLESGDPILARAAEIVSSVGPLPVSQARMRRVRRRLDEPRRGMGSVLLRPAVVVGVLFGLTAVAAATWGTIRAVRPRAPEPAIEVPAPAAAVEPAKRSRPAPAPVAAEPASDGATPRSEPRPRPAPAASEAAMVQAAVEALRREGDPERASRLLDQYRKRNPGGVLGEEALALAVEAALARKDPQAADLARQYLARYPNGRFRAVALEALQRAGPH